MKKFYENHKKSCVYAGALTAFLALYAALGFLGAPWLLTSVAPKILADKNASLSITKAEFNPFTFELNVTGIALKTNSDVFKADSIFIELNARKIFKAELNLAKVVLNNPAVNIERNADLSFNFTPLIQTDEPEKKDEKASGESFFNVTLDTFEIIKGDARYADNSLKKPFAATLKDVSYKITNINLKEYSAGKHTLDTGSSLFSEFDWNGGVSLKPLKIYGSVSFKDLNVSKIAQSYVDAADLNISEGLLNARLKYVVSIDEAGIGAQLEGARISAKDFAARQNETKLNFSELTLDGLNLNGNFGDANELSASLKGLNLSEFALNETALKQTAISDIKLKLNKDGDAGVEIGDLNSSNFNLNGADYEAGLGGVLIRDINASGKDEFKNLALSVEEISLNFPKFSGFNVAAFSENFSLNDVNASLVLENNATKIGVRLGSFKTAPIDVSGAKEKLLRVDFLSANDLNFSGDKVNLKNFSIGKTEVFSGKKSFGGFGKILSEGLNFNLQNQNLILADARIEDAFYADELSKNGAEAINNLAVLRPKKSVKTAKTQPRQAQKNKSDFVAVIKNIELINAKANISQRFLPKRTSHEIVLKNAKISDFSSDFSKPFGLVLNAATGEKISLNANGKISLEPLDVSLNLKTNFNDLAALNKIVQNYLNAEISSGKIAMNTKVNFSKTYKIQGDFKMSKFGLNDANGTKTVAIDEIKIGKIALDEHGIKMKNLAVNSPFIKAHLDANRMFNLTKLLKTSDENASEPDGESRKTGDEKPFAVNLENLALNNVDVDFSDDSLVLPFVFGIKNLNAKIDRVQNGAISRISSNGVIGSGGSANVEIKTDALNPKKFSEIRLNFKDVELSEVTPYSATFVGRKIDSGLLNLALVYDIEDRKMDGENNIVIDKIKLGESVESDSAVSLPLQLAISILQDSNGVINLNLPVSGDLDNPQFSYGGIVWQAIKQIFVDVVSSPFRLIGSALGIKDAGELAAIDFTAGSSEIMESQSKKIARFKGIADTKKDVIFVISPALNKQADEFALQKLSVDKLVSRTAASSGKSEFEALQDIARAKLKNPPADPRDELARLQKVTEADLEKLASKRAENIFNAMTAAGVPQNQLKIADKIQEADVKTNVYVGAPIGIENLK